MPYASRILPDKYSGTPIKPAYCLGKFYAREIENCLVLLLDNIYRYLWKERVPPRQMDLNRQSVACNRSVA
jgi:hypothetical protein